MISVLITTAMIILSLVFLYTGMKGLAALTITLTVVPLLFVIKHLISLFPGHRE